MTEATYPRLIEATRRAAYWEVQEGLYQATMHVQVKPCTHSGYRSLEALKRLKGEPMPRRMNSRVRREYDRQGL